MHNGLYMKINTPDSNRNIAMTLTDTGAYSFGRHSAKLLEITEPLGRIFIAAIFLVSGVGKVFAYSGTADYMMSFRVPVELLPLVIATEVLGGVALVIGWRTRTAAFLLAGFTLLAGVLFHRGSAERIQLLKNVAIAGGLAVLVRNGGGAYSVDRRLEGSMVSGHGAARRRSNECHGR